MNSTPAPNRVRSLLFWGVLVCVIVGFPLGAAEVFARVMFQTSNDPYLAFGRVNSFFETTQVGGVSYTKVIHREVYRERNIVFQTRKLPTTFRVFVLGESASAGWPHPPTEIFSAYLQTALERAYPDRHIEIINVSAHAYPAYRVHLIFDEVLNFDPDLLILWTGNNEFLEKRQYDAPNKWTDALANVADRFSVYRILRGSTVGRTIFPNNTLSDEAREHVGYEVWSKIQQEPLELRSDPTQFAGVRRHYEFSVRSMAESAREHHVPMIALTVPVNLREWIPNVSVNSAKGLALDGWQDAYRQGRAAVLRGDAAAGVTSLREAVAIDDRHAASHYYLAQALEASHDYAGALREYQRARDLDYNPFRALSWFNDTVRGVAHDDDNVTLVDAERIFNTADAPLAPGFDLFLDYVHPTVRGNELMARSIYDAIVAKKYVGRGTDVAFDDGRAADSYVDAKDYEMLRTEMLLYAMMHQNEKTLQEARALAGAPDAAKVLKPDMMDNVRQTLAVFSDVNDLERRDLLSDSVTDAERRHVRAELNLLYQASYEGYADFQKDSGQ